ncbi:MAG TPA: histidinol-phosphatase [Ignavibacteriaceae bacterium]|nr:histidinol-phosphatase [Ignavibacteriaceae bacterium]
MKNSLNTGELKEFKKFTKKLSEVSSRIIKNYFRSELQIETKQDHSPVTLADKKSEEAMRELIMKEFPEHGILGEEFGMHNPDAEYKWVLDPIDGTKSFISGTPLFGTLIALLKNGEPQLGAINLPALNEFLIGDNSIAELNDKKVMVRNCSSISSAVLLTTDIVDIEKYHNTKKFNSLIKEVKLFRTWGDCYGYYLVASGFADIMIDPIVSPWDSMALIPVIRGAGGIITDYQGNDPVKGKSIIASSPPIHKEIIELLN